MTAKEGSEKTASKINSDLLHYLKELARIEKKYRPKIISMTANYWKEIDNLNERIDRSIGG